MSYLCQRGVAQALVAEINCAPASMWLRGRESSYIPNMARKRAFRIGRSRTGLGLFATAPITKGAFIVEYKGRKLTTEQANKLEARERRRNGRWLRKLPPLGSGAPLTLSAGASGSSVRVDPSKLGPQGTLTTELKIAGQQG